MVSGFACGNNTIVANITGLPDYRIMIKPGHPRVRTKVTLLTTSISIQVIGTFTGGTHTIMAGGANCVKGIMVHNST
jgi:hypothetical protein